VNTPVANAVSRAEVEDLLYHEAELLDGWKVCCGEVSER